MCILVTLLFLCGDTVTPDCSGVDSSGEPKALTFEGVDEENPVFPPDLGGTIAVIDIHHEFYEKYLYT